MTGYKIPVLCHRGEVVEDHRNFEEVQCWDQNHPRYTEARQLDDERCCDCGRGDVTRPKLVVLQGGK